MQFGVSLRRRAFAHDNMRARLFTPLCWPLSRRFPVRDQPRRSLRTSAVARSRWCRWSSRPALLLRPSLVT